MRRLPVALSAALLVTVMTVLPATAADTNTWYVAPSGSGGTSCAHPDFHAIQPAIDAAGPGDSILVCPGSYSGALTIAGSGKDGLTIKATTPHAAKVRPPKAGDDVSDLLSIVDADRVHIQWLVFAARGDAPCVAVDTMIAIRGSSTNTVISANRLRVSGSSTVYQGPCGYSNGIVQQHDAVKVMIRYNTIDDWDGGGYGIFVGGRQPSIVRNGLHYRKTDQTIQGGVSGVGIEVTDRAGGALIRGNHVIGLSTAVATGPGTPMLSAGIELSGITGAGVETSLVRYAYDGIVVSGSGTTDDVLTDNVVRHSGGDGIRLQDQSDAHVIDNTSLGSGGFDCHDVNPHDFNTWSGNTAVTSDPPGLCGAP